MTESPDPVFPALVDVIGDELFARVAVKDRLETREDAYAIAELIADAVLYRFAVSERSAPGDVS